MSFSKLRSGFEEVFIILIQDQNGRTKEKWTGLIRDFHKAVKILDDKYGLDIWKKRDEEKKDKDLDWALK